MSYFGQEPLREAAESMNEPSATVSRARWDDIRARIADLEADNAKLRAERDEQRDFWRNFYRNLAHYRAVAPAQAPGFPARALRFSRWDTPR